jgi:lipoyl(octanoyl) transferase
MTAATIMRVLHVSGLLPYRETAARQADLVEQRLRDEIPDTVILLEHSPVITLGRSASAQHVLRSEDELAAAGVAVERTPRGGDVTYHAPGQLVVYPIIKLSGPEADVHGYVERLEELAVRAAADFGVRAFRRKGMVGAWTEKGKIAAVGVRVRKWVTSHGMCFNVDLDLSGYTAIVPCGLVDRNIASLRSILGDACPSVSVVRDSVTGHLQDLFGRRADVIRCGADALLGP